MAPHRPSRRPSARPLWLGAGTAALASLALASAALLLPRPAAPALGAVLLGALLCIAAGRLLRRRGGAQRVGGLAGLADLSAREFDARLLAALREQGYEPVHVRPGRRVDLALRRDRGTYLVYSRDWRADKLGAEVVRELHASVESQGAAGGFVVCAGRFSREAQRVAAGTPLRLIDGAALAAMLPPPADSGAAQRA